MLSHNFFLDTCGNGSICVRIGGGRGGRGVLSLAVGGVGRGVGRLHLGLDQLLPFPRVGLPVEDGLVVQELGALSVDGLLPEGLVLQELKEVEADGILEELDVLGLLPVEQVLEVVDELGLLEVAALGQEVQVVGVSQALHELQLDLKSNALLLLRVRVGRCL